MSKKKSIICLSILVFVMLFVSVFAVLPSFQVGVYDYKSPLSSIKLGLDLKGGVYVTFEVDPESLENIEGNVDSAIANTAKIMQDRLAAKGYTEATVTAVNNSTSGINNIRVEIPDVSNPDEVFDILAKPAKLKMLVSTTDKEITKSSNIISASAVIDTSNAGSYAVQIRMNNAGKNDLIEATRGMKAGDKIKFTLDGETISEPGLKENGPLITDTTLITDMATMEEAEALAVQISSGAYEISFKDNEIERRVISATLGEEAIQTVLIAGVVSLMLIVVFMILIYGVYGIAASLALLGYTILMILALAYIPFVQLTLPGIAGIILGIGMAVDANIIMFERIKDEYKSGKSFRSAYEDGSRRSLSAILDSNITTLIGGITLWILATGSVQGFAITLVFSVIISLFSALVMTKLFTNLLMPITKEKPNLYKLKRLEVE